MRYSVPDVYVEELSFHSKNIKPVSTDIAGFAGTTERGPLAPLLITNWAEFEQHYGTSFSPTAYLPAAVKGFFENGGFRCHIARICGNHAAVAQTTLGPNLSTCAVGPGIWGNRLQISIKPNTTTFSLKVTLHTADNLRTQTTEEYENLTFQRGHAFKVVNTKSQLIRLWQTGDRSPSTKKLTPEQWLSDGSDGATLTADDFDGRLGLNMPELPDSSDNRNSGLAGLNDIDEISLLIAPEDVLFADTVAQKIIAQCENRRDRFAIISASEHPHSISTLHPPADSSFAAFYHPWVQTTEGESIPAAGHIAGIYAHTDITRGIHKAPANQAIHGISGITTPITRVTQTMLNPRGVNCLRSFPERGHRVWGARTMTSDPQWRYIPVRRTSIMIEESLQTGLQWVLFEPNNQNTWTKVRGVTQQFLGMLWQRGILAGRTQSESYFVRCDRTTMTQDDMANHRLILEFGIALVRPAEFTVIRMNLNTAS